MNYFPVFPGSACRGDAPGEHGGETPPNDESLQYVGQFFMTNGIFVGQF